MDQPALVSVSLRGAHGNTSDFSFILPEEKAGKGPTSAEQVQEAANKY